MYFHKQNGNSHDTGKIIHDDVNDDAAHMLIKKRGVQMPQGISKAFFLFSVYLFLVCLYANLFLVLQVGNPSLARDLFTT